MSKMIYVLVRSIGPSYDCEEKLEEAFLSEAKANEVMAELESMKDAYESACNTFAAHILDIPIRAATAATIAAHDYLEMQRFLEHFVNKNSQDYDKALLSEYAKGMERWGNDNPARVSLLWRKGYPLFEGFLSVVEVPFNE